MNIKAYSVIEKRLLLLGSAVLLNFILIGVNVFGQDLSEIKKLCQNLTPANKILAERAGYDVSTLCSQSESMGKIASTSRGVVPLSEKVPRTTVSDTAKMVNQSSEKASESKDSPTKQHFAILSDAFKPRDQGVLKPYGYDLFANAPTTFAPAESLPVSADYLLGPGDTLDILFYGKINNTFTLEINREGFVDFPEIGPVGLAGLTYGEAKEMLQTRIDTQIVGTKVSITMGSLRTMQVFVLGEAHKPGAYTVSSLSTITHALVSSGGISNIGSLRNIMVKRDGDTIASLDLYDLLLKGDTKNDIRLQASDVVYIPVVGDLVSIDGEVLRPAIYELRGGESIEDLVEIAGGMGMKAFPSSAEILRIDNDGFMTAVDVDLSKASDARTLLKNGDYLRINSIIDEKKGVVMLDGFVYHPGRFAFEEGMTIKDLLSRIEDVPKGLDLEYGLITRTDPVSGYLSVLAFKPREMLNSANFSSKNIQLQDRDIVRLFSIDGDRNSEIRGVVNALIRQSRAGDLPAVADISGARLSGRYPITENMTITDLIVAAGGLTPNYADLDYSVIVREEITSLGEIKVFSVNLREALKNPKGDHDLKVQPKDQLYIFSVNESRPDTLKSVLERLQQQAKLDNSARIVTLSGTVRFPGKYPLTPEMSIIDAITAAGGLTESAYRSAAEIARVDLSDPEIAKTRIVYSSLRDSSKPKMLEPKDFVQFRIIPDFSEIKTISLEGEFMFPGVYAFEKGETLSSVINRAGGFTDEAFIGGSIFLREELRRREQSEINRLSRLIEERINLNRLEEVNSNSSISSEDLEAQEKAIKALDGVAALGRLVIDLEELDQLPNNDIQLRDKDRLLIPKFSQEVTVLGEVQRPTSFTFQKKLDRRDYIKLAGDLKDGADKSAIYVVRANGEVIQNSYTWLFNFADRSSRIEAGDTIVVPLDTDSSRIRGIPLFAEVSSIIYQLSLGAAAINSFSSD